MTTDSADRSSHESLAAAAEGLHTKSAVFVGLARDCAAALPLALVNIHNLAALFGGSAFVFAENDSRDGTLEILETFGAGRQGFHCLTFDGLAKKLPVRTRRLAFLRNKCVSLVRADRRLRDADYLIIMDMDAANSEPLDRRTVLDGFRFLESEDTIAGIFANSRGVYYDMWALREETRCPGDIWEEQADYVLAHRADDATAYANAVAPRIFTLPETAAPLLVSSAFGGLGIYKMHYALAGSYRGFKTKEILLDGKKRQIKWQVCEHVSFNEDIARRGGRLYIVPSLINRQTQDLAFERSFYRTLIF